MMRILRAKSAASWEKQDRRLSNEKGVTDRALA